MDNLEGNISLNSIKFYNELSNYMSQYQDINILKQYYMQRSRIVSTRDNINLPARETKSTVKCPKCCMHRSWNNSEYRVVSQRANDRFVRRIKKKIASGNLTRYQLKCAKKLQKCLGNQLVIQCKICCTKSKEILQRAREENIKKPLQPQDKLEQKTASPISKSTFNFKKNGKKQNVKDNKKINERLGKLNKFLSTSHSIKTSSLKDFIKSVT